MNNGLKVFSVLILFILSEQVLAAVYKWTDENGAVHYGDKPNGQSAGQNNATEIKVETQSKSGITHSSDQKEKRDRIIKVLEEDRKEREKKRKKYYAEKNKRLKRCARLKDKLRRYQDANAVYKLDKKGERQYYSNKERAAKESALRKKINKTCHGW